MSLNLPGGIKQEGHAMRMGLAAFVALLAVASAEAGWQDRLPVGKGALVVKVNPWDGLSQFSSGQ